MIAIPDLRIDRHEVGSFDKDIPGIPSYRIVIQQEGRRVRLEYVAWENDTEVSRRVYEGTLEGWFPRARLAFVRIDGTGDRMAVRADDGLYEFGRSPEALVDAGAEYVRF